MKYFLRIPGSAGSSWISRWPQSSMYKQLSLVLVKMLAEHGAHNRLRQYKEAKERLVEWRVNAEGRSGLQQWAMEKRGQKGEQERIGEN